MRHLHPSTESQRPKTLRRSAYTLLELLIASILLAMLMAAVWNLMSMYSSFLIAGRSQAAEQQLSRSLMDLVATDLRATAPAQFEPVTVTLERSHDDSKRTLSTSDARSRPMRFPSAATSEFPDNSEWPNDDDALSASGVPLPEIAFSGNDRSLTLMCLQREPNFEGRRTNDGDDLANLTEAPLDVGLADLATRSGNGLAPARAVAPEWTQVIYQFIPPRTERRDDRELPPGLHRFEIPVEYLGLVTQIDGGRDAGIADAAMDPLGKFPSEFADSIEMLLEQGVEEISHEHVPEVVACRFEYFSGSDWRRDWGHAPDSPRPTAVRISLRLLSTTEHRELSNLLGSDDADAALTGDPTLAEPALDEPGSADPFDAFDPRLYRRTILLDLDRDSLRQRNSAAPKSSPSLASSPYSPGGAE